MDSIIALHDVENLGTGAIGEPGSREFFVQARNSAMQLTVLVEKQQVALLATEVISFLDRIAEEHPEDTLALPTEEACVNPRSRYLEPDSSVWVLTPI